MDVTFAFLNAVGNKDVVSLIYHGDPDGCCAAVLLRSALNVLFDRPIDHTYWVGTHEFDFVALESYLQGIRADHAILVDINLRSRPGALEAVARLVNKAVFIYDDHPWVKESPIPSNVTYVNPSATYGDRAPIPPCLFARDIQMQSSSTDMDWIAGVGLVGETVDKHYPQFMQSLPLERQRLSQVARMITAYYLDLSQDKQHDLALRALSTAGSKGAPLSLLTSEDEAVATLHRVEETVSEEVSRNVRRFVQTTPLTRVSGIDLYAFEVHSTFRIVNLVASNVRWKLRRSIIFTYQHLPDRVMIETRSTSDLRAEIDLVHLLERVFRQVPSLNMGGHPVAAGAAITTTNLARFLRVLPVALEEEMQNAAR